jgi:cellulose synthase/poly-beta-1,6-N-acetylglucosamine synthase-like glycosyltransferase
LIGPSDRESKGDKGCRLDRAGCKNVGTATPPLNQGQFVERTGVLSQEWADLEYIVVDGGSTDYAHEIIRRYRDRVRWVSETDDGQSDAVNKRINVTRAKIIGCLNSDDLYCPGAISSAVVFFIGNPDIEINLGKRGLCRC